MTARDGACCALYARTFPFRHAALLLVPTSARRPFQASAFALSSVMRTIRRGIVPLRCARCRAWQGQCVGVQAKYLVCPVKGKSVACMLQTRRFALLAGRQTAAWSGLAHSGNGFVPLRRAKEAFRAGGSRQPYVLTSEHDRFFLRAVWRANCVLISGRSVGGLFVQLRQ